MCLSSSNSNSSQPDIDPTDPTTVNNKLLAVNIDHYPFEEIYNEEDLNINWNPDNQKYTGFLPVTIKATGVPSYTSFYADVDGQLFEQPIEYNGKYKFVLKNDGPFATGLMPQFMRDQTSNSYDIYINVPNSPPDLSENIATLQITDGVLDSVLQLENGILNLPSSIPALNTATNFNTNGKDYATGVSIDLTNLTYYSSMPEIDNGNYGNVIPVNENNVEITLLDDNNDKTDVEHTITPYNPNPTKRSIKVVNFTKDSNTRDITSKDIVGYIRVNIPPPSISSTISTNGYYNFNNEWNGLIEGTEQDHALSIGVQPSLQSKSVTIDSIESNQSTIIEKTGVYNPLIPVLSSLNYNNGEIVISGVYYSGGWKNTTNVIKLFDGKDNNYFQISSPEHHLRVTISFRDSKTVKKLTTNVWKNCNIILDGCTDISNPEWKFIKQKQTNQGSDNHLHLYELEIDTNDSYKNYRISYEGTNYAVGETNLYDLTTFDGLDKITIINNTDSKVYKGYDNNNKYSITQTGDGTITIPTNYQALGEIKYNVNVPTTLVDNADVDSQNNNVISTNGTYTIPTGKTGWNSFEVDVPNDVNNYNGYTTANPLILDNNGTGAITIPQNYTGLGTVHYNVAVSDQQLKLEQNYEATFDGAVGQSVVLTPSAGYNGFENVRVTILRPSDKKEIYQIRFGNSRYTISNEYFTKYTTNFTMQPNDVVISLLKGNGFFIVTVFFVRQQTNYNIENSYYRVIQDLGSTVQTFWLQDYTEHDIVGGWLAPNNDTRNCYLYLDDGEYTLRDFNF